MEPGVALQWCEQVSIAVWFGEDLGSQTSTLISPDDWRRMFKWRHKRMIEKLKKENPELIIIMHFSKRYLDHREKNL